MRVKSNTRYRHKKLLSQTKGFRMTKNRLVTVASDALLHAGQYAFAGRRLRRRDLRSLWTVRINAALRALDNKYSTFISDLKKSNITLDRKVLSELATNHPKVFQAVVKATKSKA